MLTGLGHIAFRVTDLEKARNFYCNKLGLREVFRLESKNDPSHEIIYIQVAPGHFIELLPSTSTQEKEISSERTVGFNHFCLLVDDLQATLRTFEAHGLELTDTPYYGLDHNWQYLIQDPDGNTIELLQTSPELPQAAADASWFTTA
jgi:lactoylglutathione lyase